MGYESGKNISVAFSYKYCSTNLIVYDINDLILDIRGSIFLLLLVLHCSYIFGKYWVTLCLWIQNCHRITWLQSMMTTASTAIFWFLIFNNACLFFFIWVFLNSESLQIIGSSTEYLDVTDKKRTYTSYINIYLFFISLYKTLHIKRIDDQHCGVLVKTHNIFKLQKVNVYQNSKHL
jgi:hypothetical protein